MIEDALKNGKSYSMDQLTNMSDRFKNTLITSMLDHDS